MKMRTTINTPFKQYFLGVVYVCFGLTFLPTDIITYPLQNPIKNIICCPE
jgi:hypothetical protein